MSANTGSEQWIELDPRTLDLPEAEERRRGDVHISIFMSPHDVPEAVRGYFDGDDNRFVIEFRYLDSEPWKRQPGDGMVRLRLGKHSRRLCGVEIDLNRVEAETVSLEIREEVWQEIRQKALSAIKNLMHKESAGRLEENYRVAGKVVDRFRPTPAAYAL